METNLIQTKTFTLQREPKLPRKAMLEIIEDRQFNVQLWQNRPNTCFVMSSWYDGHEYTGFGFSKVCYPDSWDPENGVSIARRKAAIMILHQIRAKKNHTEEKQT